MTEQEDIPNPLALELKAGDSETEYPELPKNIHVLGVTIRGMRNREIKLIRVRPSDLRKYSPSLRGMPTMYSIDFKERRIRFFPAALNTYTVFLKHGSPAALVEDDRDAVA